MAAFETTLSVPFSLFASIYSFSFALFLSPASVRCKYVLSPSNLNPEILISQTFPTSVQGRERSVVSARDAAHVSRRLRRATPRTIVLLSSFSLLSFLSFVLQMHFICLSLSPFRISFCATSDVDSRSTPTTSSRSTSCTPAIILKAMCVLVRFDDVVTKCRGLLRLTIIYKKQFGCGWRCIAVAEELAELEVAKNVISLSLSLFVVCFSRLFCRMVVGSTRSPFSLIAKSTPTSFSIVISRDNRQRRRR